MKSNAHIASVRVSCTQTQTQMTLKQKTCSNKSVTHMKCCQTRKHVVVTTDSAMQAFLVPDLVAVQTHSVEAAVLATSLKPSSVVVAVVSKQDLRVDKTSR
jgi:hypothetical protein